MSLYDRIPQTRRQQLLVRRAAVRVAQAEADGRDIRTEFKLTDRPPLRAIAAGKKTA
jgi:hypothetical protein